MYSSNETNMHQCMREKMGRKKGEGKRGEEREIHRKRCRRVGEIIQGSENPIELGRRKVRVREAETHVLKPSLSLRP